MVIPVNTRENAYDIVLERGALQKIGTLLPLRRRVLIVTDSGVPSAYREAVEKASEAPVSVVLPRGEASKNMEHFRLLLETMLKKGFSRKDCVVAVGGGMVGDLAGFSASCYMRGVDFYNVPTTLLSQVDSSIGGKTAIDFCGVKNAVGSFYQPRKVVIDPDTLKTLELRELYAGLAEAIKMAAAMDEELFTMIERSPSLEDGLCEIIRRSLLIKKRVVEEDPKETGLRKVLNFGHTLGHGFESASAGNMLHGEAVALGMLYMADSDVRERLKALYRRYGLPVSSAYDPDEVLSYVSHDKKKNEHGFSVVYVPAIGRFEFREMSLQALFARLGETI